MGGRFKIGVFKVKCLIFLLNRTVFRASMFLEAKRCACNDILYVHRASPMGKRQVADHITFDRKIYLGLYLYIIILNISIVHNENIYNCNKILHAFLNKLN